MKAQCTDCGKPLAQIDFVRRGDPGGLLERDPLCEPCWREQDIEAMAREGNRWSD